MCYRRNARPIRNGLQTSFKTRKRLVYSQQRVWLKIEQNNNYLQRLKTERTNYEKHRLPALSRNDW